MRHELVSSLTDIKEIAIMSRMLRNMNSSDLFMLMSLLDYTDESTQSRWISTYNQIF